MIADALYVGDTSVGRVMLGDVEVWSADPNLPVVTITGTATNVARGQFRQACVDFGTTFDTVTVLPFRLDTSAVTSMRNMFSGCSALTTVPEMDTSNVDTMRSMFSGCSSLTSVPPLDTSNVTTMQGMFLDCVALTPAPLLDTSNVDTMPLMFSGCAALAHVPDLATSNVALMNSMFESCAALTDGNVRLIGKHPTVSTISMIDGSGLTREPFYDTDGNPI